MLGNYNHMQEEGFKSKKRLKGPEETGNNKKSREDNGFFCDVLSESFQRNLGFSSGDEDDNNNDEVEGDEFKQVDDLRLMFGNVLHENGKKDPLIPAIMENPEEWKDGTFQSRVWSNVKIETGAEVGDEVGRRI